MILKRLFSFLLTLSLFVAQVTSVFMSGSAYADEDLDALHVPTEELAPDPETPPAPAPSSTSHQHYLEEAAVHLRSYMNQKHHKLGLLQPTPTCRALHEMTVEQACHEERTGDPLERIRGCLLQASYFQNMALSFRELRRFKRNRAYNENIEGLAAYAAARASQQYLDLTGDTVDAEVVKYYVKGELTLVPEDMTDKQVRGRKGRIYFKNRCKNSATLAANSHNLAGSDYAMFVSNMQGNPKAAHDIADPTSQNYCRKLYDKSRRVIQGIHRPEGNNHTGVRRAHHEGFYPFGTGYNHAKLAGTHRTKAQQIWTDQRDNKRIFKKCGGFGRLLLNGLVWGGGGYLLFKGFKALFGNDSEEVKKSASNDKEEDKEEEKEETRRPCGKKKGKKKCRPNRNVASTTSQVVEAPPVVPTEPNVAADALAEPAPDVESAPAPEVIVEAAEEAAPTPVTPAAQPIVVDFEDREPATEETRRDAEPLLVDNNTDALADGASDDFGTRGLNRRPAALPSERVGRALSESGAI